MTQTPHEDGPQPLDDETLDGVAGGTLNKTGALDPLKPAPKPQPPRDGYVTYDEMDGL